MNSLGGKTNHKGICSWVSASLMLLFLLVVLSCDGLFGMEDQGSLVVRFSGSGRNSDPSLVWTPGISTEIDHYTISLTHATAPAVEVTGHADDLLVMDALAAGIWTLEIDAFNAGGDPIAYLVENSKGQRQLDAMVQRGKTTTVNALVVPVDDPDKTGTLELTMDWSPVESRLMLENPEIRISITCLNDSLAQYTAPTGAEPIGLSGDAAGTGPGQTDEITLSDLGSVGIAFTVDRGVDLGNPVLESTFGFSGMPAGWYEIIIGLYSNTTENPDVRLWQGIGHAHVVYVEPQGGVQTSTTGSIELSEENLETGALDLTIDQDMQEQLDVSVFVSQTEYQSGDEVDADPHMQATFTASIGDADLYRWYINGDVQQGADTVEFSCVFDDPGYYFVMVSVFKDGYWGQCLARVSANYEIGDLGPAGGVIFFDKKQVDNSAYMWDSFAGAHVPHPTLDTGDLYWRYLEAAPVAALCNVPWSSVTDTACGASDMELGMGWVNTLAIIGQAGHTGSAAQTCVDYHTEIDSIVFDDWFLPSKNELHLMHMMIKDSGVFDDGYYLSSTEASATEEWKQVFAFDEIQANDGLQSAANKASFEQLDTVHAIRAF